MRGSAAKGEWIKLYPRPSGRVQWRARLRAPKDQLDGMVYAVEYEGWLDPAKGQTLGTLRAMLAERTGRALDQVPSGRT